MPPLDYDFFSFLCGIVVCPIHHRLVSSFASPAHLGPLPSPLFPISTKANLLSFSFLKTSSLLTPLLFPILDRLLLPGPHTRRLLSLEGRQRVLRFLPSCPIHRFLQTTTVFLFPLQPIFTSTCPTPPSPPPQRSTSSRALHSRPRASWFAASSRHQNSSSCPDIFEGKESSWSSFSLLIRSTYVASRLSLFISSQNISFQHPPNNVVSYWPTATVCRNTTL